MPFFSGPLEQINDKNWKEIGSYSGRQSLKKQAKTIFLNLLRTCETFQRFCNDAKNTREKIFPKGLDKRKYVFIVKELNNSTNWNGIRKLAPQFSQAGRNWLSCYYFTYSMPYVTLISFFSGQESTQEITSTADPNWNSCSQSVQKALIF